MLTQSEKCALLQAVSRFSPTRGIDQSALEQAVDAFNGFRLADLLRDLIRRQLLTPIQAQGLELIIPHLHSKSSNHHRNEHVVIDEHQRDVSEAPTMIALKQKQEQTYEPDPEYGTVFGEYRVLRKLGQGGMCSVFLGYRESDNFKVAIKVLPETLAAKQATLDRFIREAKSATILKHPNIVRGYDYGQDQETGKHYLVLEYVDGRSASELIAQYVRLAVGDAVHIILDIARGLEYAHSRNIIHRDIKPDNILLTRTGVAKITDMGLAKRTDVPSHLTGTHQGFGTPSYMPYEQAVNARNADGRSDIYALGATLYHLLTGEVPFAGENHIVILEKKSVGDFAPASSLNPLVPAVLDTILNKMIALEPQDRYQTISEVIVDLERTNLAPAVPSFIDEHLALQDPVVRERWASVSQPTSPDLNGLAAGLANGHAVNSDYWYIRYRVDHTEWCKAKSTTEQIVKLLHEKKIPLTTEVSRHLHGDYRRLTECTEFQTYLQKLRKRRKKRRQQQDQLTANEPTKPIDFLQPAKKQSANWGVFGGGVAVFVILTTVLIVLIQLLSGT